MQAFFSLLKNHSVRAPTLVLTTIFVALGQMAQANNEPPAKWPLWLQQETAPELSIFPDELALKQDLSNALKSPPAKTPTKAGFQPATLYWTNLAIELVQKYQQNPLRAARVMALTNVAIHDAFVSASIAGHPPNLWPVAAHAAASDMLQHLYPKEPPGRFAAVARLAVIENAVSAKPAASIDTIVSTWNTGKLIAQLAIARAINDGADRLWNLSERPAAARGVWRDTPPLNIYKPAEPLAGKWRTWALKTGAEIQAPPPVTFDNDEYWRETAEVLEVTRHLTAEQKRIAEDWNLDLGTATPPGVWNKIAQQAVLQQKLDEASTVRIFATLNTAMYDAMIACWQVKFTYWTQRPITSIREKLDPNFLPHIITPAFPSYVSGHASVSGAASEVLATLLPNRANEFRSKAKEAALSRLYGGIHFRSDNEQGLVLGQRVAQRTLVRAGITAATP